MLVVLFSAGVVYVRVAPLQTLPCLTTSSPALSLLRSLTGGLTRARPAPGPRPRDPGPAPGQAGPLRATPRTRCSVQHRPDGVQLGLDDLSLSRETAQHLR